MHLPPTPHHPQRRPSRLLHAHRAPALALLALRSEACLPQRCCSAAASRLDSRCRAVRPARTSRPDRMARGLATATVRGLAIATVPGLAVETVRGLVIATVSVHRSTAIFRYRARTTLTLTTVRPKTDQVILRRRLRRAARALASTRGVTPIDQRVMVPPATHG